MTVCKVHVDKHGLSVDKHGLSVDKHGLSGKNLALRATICGFYAPAAEACEQTNVETNKYLTDASRQIRRIWWIGHVRPWGFPVGPDGNRVSGTPTALVHKMVCPKATELIEGKYILELRMLQ